MLIKTQDTNYWVLITIPPMKCQWSDGVISALSVNYDPSGGVIIVLSVNCHLSDALIKCSEFLITTPPME